MPISSPSGIWFSGSGKTLYRFARTGGAHRLDVAVAVGGELHRADVRSGRVHGQMHLAPPLTVCRQTVAGQRLASALNAMLSGLPVAITEDLDASAVHKQVEGATAAPIRDLDGKGLLPPTQGRSVGHSPVEVRNLSRLAAFPVVCLGGSLNRTLIVRQNWIAASQNTAGRPGLPSGGASQAMSLSNQISRNPALAQRRSVAGPVRGAVAGG